MRSSLIGILVLLWCLSAIAFPVKWIAYYSNKEPEAAFKPYQVIVFDSDYHPSLRYLKFSHKKILGYISLGEVEKHRWYFHKMKKAGLLLQENKSWPGSYLIDVRDKRWTKLVIGKLIPNILFQGFNGIFIDTLDNPEYLQEQNPKKYQGMVKASANLVKLIRLNYPGITIMLNRAYKILPLVSKDINIELGESMYSDYNFKTKEYQKVDAKEYQDQVDLLKKAMRNNTSLQVYSLDYWYPDQKEMIKKIYQIEIKNGFSPYVATVELDKIIPGPKLESK